MEPVIRILPSPPPLHVGRDKVEQAHRAGNVGVDHALDVVPILIEEGPAEAVTGVGEQAADRTSHRLGLGEQLVDALDGREIDLQRLDLGAERPQFAGGIFQWPIRRDQQVVIV